MKNKKALIVSPYLDHLGGGERYMLSVAQVLEELGHEIYFAWDNLVEINTLSEMLGINLKKPQFDAVVKDLYFANNPAKMFFATKIYDVVVYLSDGSLPMLGGRKNIVHMQVPFHNVNGKGWKNQLKKHFIDAVIVNSEFTKQVVDREYGIRSRVVYPPVDTSVKRSEKTKTILSVGRFEPSLNAKKQDVLIESFRKLSPRLPGWKLVLAGASASDDWVNKLKKLADGLPIEFAINAPFEQLSKLYQEASIYWHAAGYGLDENKNPELVEHFGITTVEAIASGCVPLVVPYGGQREIVTDAALHWETIDDLVAKTLTIVMDEQRDKILSSLKIDAYSQIAFRESISNIIGL